MRHPWVTVTTVTVTVIITVFLYKPVSLAIYTIREPYFAYPVKPVSGKVVIRNDGRGDGEFGARRRNGRTHAGIDMLAPVGTPVYASKSGIAFCGNVPTGYGKYIMIYHPDGYQTMYGHLSGSCVVSTQKVRRGDLIGFVGKTGNAASKSIEPHLHFEIRKDDGPLNPRPLMR
ncbi:MAG: M23 family metallopeptidase [Candidatus Omnitrophota bacterium]